MKFTGSEGLRTRRWFSPVLVLLLAFTSPFTSTMRAQAQATPSPAQAAKPAVMSQSLRVLALTGNGEVNDLEGRVMAPLVVNVLDQNGRPIEGADVVFRFPVSGPSATFADGSTSQTVRSNADGQAGASGWMANSQLGNVRVQVTATQGNEMGGTVITMINGSRASAQDLRKSKSWWSSKWVKIGVIGGAAAATGLSIWATHRGSGGTVASGTTVSASPGGPTIGGPR